MNILSVEEVLTVLIPQIDILGRFSPSLREELLMNSMEELDDLDEVNLDWLWDED